MRQSFIAVILLSLVLLSCGKDEDEFASFVIGEEHTDDYLHTGLPVLYLDTKDARNIVSKTDYLTATLSIWDNGSEVGAPMACSVRGRGTPSCKPVELVLNGKHVGNYVLIEQVRADENRVPVTDGYLMECDFHFDNEVQWIDPHGRSNRFPDGIPNAVKYPDPEEITQEQLSYIKQYIHDTGEALYGPDFKDPEKGYSAYMDVDSFIDYWIVYEVMGNIALMNPGSIFCHKAAEGKLTAGPCWDFDWGVLSFVTAPKGKTSLLHSDSMWYARFFEDPAFKERAKARFQELLPKLETVPAYIESLRKTLSSSAKLNFHLWDPTQDASSNGGKIINGDENLSFDAAVDRLKANYLERLKVIKDCL